MGDNGERVKEDTGGMNKELKDLIIDIYHVVSHLEDITKKIQSKKMQDMIKTKNDILKLLQSYHATKDAFISFADSLNSLFYPQTEN